jgi:hypothetical protein
MALGVSSSSSASAVASFIAVSSKGVSKNLQKIGKSRDIYGDTNGGL